MKKICSILAVIILAVTVAFIGYDRYWLHKADEFTIVAKNTNINIVVKTQWDDGDLYTTVKVENGWFKQWVYNYIVMTEPYDDFITVFYIDKDDNVIHSVRFALKDFAETTEGNIYVARKTTELSEKKRRKIKQGNASYKGLFVKEIIQ